MSTTFRFRYRFHPAGQGIFATGDVQDWDPSIPFFHWVFDCGSVDHKHLRPIVSRYKDLLLGDFLDLLCISHFDNDHVSGLGDLLPDLHVGTVVLPYCSNLERLILGSRQRGANPEYFEFLANPVAFLLERAASIEKIVIVGGPDGDGPHIQLDLPDRPPEGDQGSRPIDRERWIFKPWELPPPATEAVCDAVTLAVAQQRGTQIYNVPTSFPASAVPSTHSAYWEFLFFHKPINPLAILGIKKRVAGLLQTLRKKSPDLDLAEVLGKEPVRKAIKDAYVKGIKSAGKTGEDINSTSLCVYSGPELATLAGTSISQPWPHPLVGSHPVQYVDHPMFPQHCSILYPGDTDFKPSVNRQQLRQFLNKPSVGPPADRWQHVGILQVPHHGSKKNWQVGSVNEFNHFHSVFCADEHHQRLQHPDREVFLDLIHHGPVLANKTLGWTWNGRVYFR